MASSGRGRPLIVRAFRFRRRLTRMRAVTLGQLKETVADVAEVGRLLRGAQPTVTWGLKPDGSVVTDLDRRIEDQLRVRLEARFPGCTFVGEEGAPSTSDTGRPRIVLDPI